MPSVNLLDNGKLWLEWSEAGIGYDLDKDEAEWLSQQLMDIVKKSKGEV